MSERYWDPQLETLPVERRRLLREHRLHWQVRRCWDGSPFYRARLEGAGLDLDTFGGLADLQRVPIIRPGDFPSPGSAGGASIEWTVAPEDWWQTQEQSEHGPVRVLTDGDVIQRAHLAARAHWAAGIRTDRSLAAVSGRPPGGTAISIPDVSPVIAYGCPESEGDHWSDDYFLIETVDPATGAGVEAGVEGALVVTDLAREGSPLLRYWTGWQANLFEEPCVCGRTSIRSTVLRPLP